MIIVLVKRSKGGVRCLLIILNTFKTSASFPLLIEYLVIALVKTLIAVKYNLLGICPENLVRWPSFNPSYALPFTSTCKFVNTFGADLKRVLIAYHG